MMWKLILLAVVLIAIFWAIHTTNGFKKKEIKVQEGLSGVEVALTKRYDMLSKMLDVAKTYAAHEKALFMEMVKLRQGMSVQELNEVDHALDGIEHTLKLTAEGYPELRSSDVFVELQHGIWDAEEHLQAARRLYNTSVTNYNTAIAVFPASLLAGGRSAKDFFATDETKKQDVTVA